MPAALTTNLPSLAVAVALQKLLLGAGKKQDLVAGAVISPLLQPGPGTCTKAVLWLLPAATALLGVGTQGGLEEALVVVVVAGRSHREAPEWSLGSSSSKGDVTLSVARSPFSLAPNSSFWLSDAAAVTHHGWGR